MAAAQQARVRSPRRSQARCVGQTKKLKSLATALPRRNTAGRALAMDDDDPFDDFDALLRIAARKEPDKVCSLKAKAYRTPKPKKNGRRARSNVPQQYGWLSRRLCCYATALVGGIVVAIIISVSSKGNTEYALEEGKHLLAEVRRHQKPCSRCRRRLAAQPPPPPDCRRRRHRHHHHRQRCRRTHRRRHRSHHCPRHHHHRHSHRRLYRQRTSMRSAFASRISRFGCCPDSSSSRPQPSRRSSI